MLKQIKTGYTNLKHNCIDTLFTEFYCLKLEGNYSTENNNAMTTQRRCRSHCCSSPLIVWHGHYTFSQCQTYWRGKENLFTYCFCLVIRVEKHWNASHYSKPIQDAYHCWTSPPTTEVFNGNRFSPLPVPPHANCRCSTLRPRQASKGENLIMGDHRHSSRVWASHYLQYSRLIAPMSSYGSAFSPLCT